MKPFKMMRAVTVIAGLVIALVIVLTQLFYFEVPSTQTTQPGAEQTAQSEHELVLLPSSFSMPTSLHLELSHEFLCIGEILFDWEEEEQAPVHVQQAAGKLFQTLFHFIISPNAP